MIHLHLYSEWTNWMFGLPNEKLDKGIRLFLSRLQDGKVADQVKLSLYAFGTSKQLFAIRPLTVRIIDCDNKTVCNGQNASQLSVHSGTLVRNSKTIDNGDFKAKFYAVRESVMNLDDSPKFPDMDQVSKHVSELLKNANAEDKIIAFVFALTAGGMPVVSRTNQSTISLHFVQVDGQNLSSFASTDWKSKSTPIHLLDGFRFVEFFDWFVLQVVSQIKDPSRKFSKRALSSWCINTIITSNPTSEFHD